MAQNIDALRNPFDQVIMRDGHRPEQFAMVLVSAFR